MTQSAEVQGRCLKNPALPCPNPSRRDAGCGNAPSARAIAMLSPELGERYRALLAPNPSEPCQQEQEGNIK